MRLAFTLGPLNVTAYYRPFVPGRRSGHPDSWTEDEPEEFDVLSVDGVADCDVTERDIIDAVRDEARSACDASCDACIEREEMTR